MQKSKYLLKFHADICILFKNYAHSQMLKNLQCSFDFNN